MQDSVYRQYRKDLKGIARSWPGYVHVAIFFALTTLAIRLALSESFALYLLGEVLLILSFINGQVLLHELGHGIFLGNKRISHLVGFIVSFSPAIPYWPWVLIHSQHHRWSGNRFQDPTMIDRDYSDLKASEIKFINFCWKYWIPVFALSYSLRSFWNTRKILRIFPEHKAAVLTSQIGLAVVLIALFAFFPMFMLKAWLPAWVIFMSVSEPLLFSQHVHIDQGDAQDENFTKTTTYHVKDQDEFCRNLIFPQWVTRWVLLGFNQHAIHHVFPNLPGYEYHHVKETFPNTVPWMQWYRFSKSVDAATLLFKTNKETQLLSRPS
jgi:omega-6 fatty acid desaturase (delta-12 desaturase)